MAEISDLAAVPLPDLLQRVHSTNTGLTASSAAAALEAVGPNRIDTARHKGLLLAFIERLGNPLVLILLFAAAVSAFTGDVPSFVIIAAIVLISVILDVSQERQAQNAAQRLSEQVSLSAKALRDGRPIDIPAVDIVPGDVIVLAAGDLVPADSRLIDARDLYVDEALLTGEAYPAEKQVAPADAAAASEAAFPRNLVFMGSSVVSGAAKALVLATGRRAQLGSIAGALQKQPPPTAFAIGIQKFGMMIVQATIFLVLFVVLVNVLFHRTLLEFISVCSGTRGRPDAGTSADDRIGDASTWRDPHVAQAGHRKASVRHRRSRQHGRAVQRQDRNTHRSPHQTGP